MGCCISKSDEDEYDRTPPVILCRQRKLLIRSAADRRFSLAAAHVAYLRSLSGVGAALVRFADENLTTFPSPSKSPVVNLPPADYKAKPSSGESAAGDPVSSGTSLSHSLSPDSHIRFLSDSESDEEIPEKIPESSYSPPPVEVMSPATDYYFMRSSTAIPSVVYDDPYYSSYGFPANSEEFGDMRPQEPPPPPPPGGSAWDFFDPFTGYDQYLPNYYSQDRFSVSSSPDSSEIRAKEGIPDLEDETEVKEEKVKDSGEVKKEKVKDSREVKKEKGKDFGEGSSKSVPEQEKNNRKEEVVVSEEKKSKNSPVSSNKGDTKGKEVILEEEEEEAVGEASSLVTEESGPSNGQVAAVQGTRDVMEVVVEIKDLFRAAANCGEEVSRMLEYGQFNYRSTSRISRVISSRILEPMGLSMLTSSHLSLKHSRQSALWNKAYSANIEKQTALKLGSLSSTLEKLYEWEKKLYKEVKDEEKLRILYVKKRKHLRSLDNRGAESYKIDAVRLSIRRLQTKMSIVIQSMNAISRRMHKIRDEELQPQITDLIRGLMRMWKSLLDCHQKQFLAIIACKSHNVKAKTESQGTSVLNATMELEIELLNWYSNFQYWITTQKAYIEALNGWLLKWLPQEMEETPDGVVPFSPSRIEAPAVYVISNDLYNVIRHISEVKVTTAMHTLAQNVQRLGEYQKEEQHQKLKVEYLSRDYASRLKSVQTDSGVHGSLDVVSATDTGQVHHDERMKELDSMRKRLDEEIAKHKEIVKQIQDAVPSNLITDLMSTFEALTEYTSETLRAYEGLRFPSEGGGN